jgi:hypothetical protein
MGGVMTGDEFARLLGDFALSAESGDGARFANHFTEERLAREKSITETTGRSL